MYRRATRRVKSEQQIIDEMVEAMLMRMTDDEIARELGDRFEAELKALPWHELEAERERLEVSVTEDPQDWEDRDELPE